MFHFSRFRSYWHILFCQQRLNFHSAGFPHSDISGLKPACGSPKLFAACHVLLRHVSPRHPPVALLSFIHKLNPFLILGYYCSLGPFFSLRIISHSKFYSFTSLLYDFFLYLLNLVLHTVNELNYSKFRNGPRWT